MIYRDSDNIWKVDKIPKSFNPIYAESLLRYFNCLDPLFKKAQETCDFEFILSLLNISGMQDPGWISFETTEDIFDFFNRLKHKIKDGKERLYLTLLLYGLIIEASFPYDLIANLLNVASGERYIANNFPDQSISRNRTRPQFPPQKINVINEKAQDINMERAVEPINEIFNRELRNSIFHSDYVIYGEEIRTPGTGNIHIRSDIVALINKALAYFEVVVSLRKIYRSTYCEPKMIDVHPNFNDQSAKANVMIREGTGAIGIRFGNAHITLLLPYEKKILEKNPDENIFPPNKIEKANRLLKIIPNPIKRKIIKYYEKKLLS